MFYLPSLLSLLRFATGMIPAKTIALVHVSYYQNIPFRLRFIKLLMDREIESLAIEGRESGTRYQTGVKQREKKHRYDVAATPTFK